MVMVPNFIKPLKLKYKLYQTQKDQGFSSRLAALFVHSKEVMRRIHWVKNEDVVRAALTGDAPTTSEWSTILLPTCFVLYQRFDDTFQIMLSVF